MNSPNICGYIWLVAAVDGVWSRFAACFEACDGGTRSRTCSDPAPAYGGKDCVGVATGACNTQACDGTGCKHERCRLFALLFFALRKIELVFTTQNVKSSGSTSLSQPKAMTTVTHSSDTFQRALYGTACSTVDGPVRRVL